MSLTQHVVMFSGGIASWAAAGRVAERHGTDNLTLLFTDTKTEDPDLYRFLDEAARDVGGELVKIADGRDIWQVFRDSRYLGNTRADPCSRILKRSLARAWVDEHCPLGFTTIYLGIEWTEVHRLPRAVEAWAPYRVEAPMADKPYRLRSELLAELEGRGIRPPRLYELGFAHNNCGGGCVKAGQSQFVQLLRVLPERYAEWERGEQSIRDHLGADVSILRDRRGGTTQPMTLAALRERVQAGDPIPMDEWAGCACFEEPVAAPSPEPEP